MSRQIRVVAIQNGESDLYLYHPNYAVSVILGLPLKTGGQDRIQIGGAGMDMGADLVMRLSYALYGDEKALIQRWI